MEINLKRPFTYQVDARTTKTIEVGVHDLPQHLAKKVLRFGKAEIVVKKKAPENKKRGKAPENKARVGGSTKRSRSPRTKPKS